MLTVSWLMACVAAAGERAFITGWIIRTPTQQAKHIELQRPL